MPIVILPARRTGPTLETLLIQLVAAGIAPPVLEYRFAPPRRWRFDLAWPSRWLAVELDGGTFVTGRHTRGVGYRRDCEKRNEAVLLGWRVLHVTPEMVSNGEAITLLEQAWARLEGR